MQCVSVHPTDWFGAKMTHSPFKTVHGYHRILKRLNEKIQSLEAEKEQLTVKLSQTQEEVIQVNSLLDSAQLTIDSLTTERDELQEQLDLLTEPE